MKLLLILAWVVVFIVIVVTIIDIRVRNRNTLSSIAKRYVKLLYMAQKANKKNKPVAEFYLAEAEQLEKVFEARLYSLDIEFSASTSELMKAQAELTKRNSFRNGFIRK